MKSIMINEIGFDFVAASDTPIESAMKSTIIIFQRVKTHPLTTAFAVIHRYLNFYAGTTERIPEISKSNSTHYPILLFVCRIYISTAPILSPDSGNCRMVFICVRIFFR